MGALEPLRLPVGFGGWREGEALVILAPARPGRGAIAALATVVAGAAAVAVGRVAAGAHGVEELLAWSATAALAAVTLRAGALTVELARPRMLRAGPAGLEVTRWWPWGPRRRAVAAGAIRAITAAAHDDDESASAAAPWTVQAVLADATRVTLLEAADQAAAEGVAAMIAAKVGRAPR